MVAKRYQKNGERRVQEYPQRSLPNVICTLFRGLIAAGGLGLLVGCAEAEKQDNVETLQATSLKVEDSIIVLSSNTARANASGNSASQVASSQANLTAYENSLFPLFRQNCVPCHTETRPKMAQDSVLGSFTAITGSDYLNFTDSINSRIVRRLTEQNHSCWGDCQENGAALSAAIDAWAAAGEISVESDEESQSAGDSGVTFQTEAVGFVGLPSASARVPLDDDDTFYELFEAESDRVFFPMQVISDATAFGGQYVVSQSGGRLAQEDDADENPQLGRIFVDFDVPEDNGNYTIYARVNTSGLESDSFFVRVDEGDYRIWDYRNLEPGWRWVPISVRREADRRETSQRRSFDLTAGRHTLEIVQRGDGLKLDALIVSRSANIDFETFVPAETSRTLVFDVSSQTPGERATFTIQIQDFNDKSYRLFNPSFGISTAEGTTESREVRVTSIKPFLNGNFLEQNATFTAIDQPVAAERVRLSGSSLILLKENGPDTDTLSFGFGSILLDTETVESDNEEP